MYRGTWLLVGLPLLVAAFSVARPAPLPPPTVPATFDRQVAVGLARELTDAAPDRSPGSEGAARAARWVAERFEVYGFQVREQAFEETIAGHGRRRLVNLFAVAPGPVPDAPALVVMAHRDNVGLGRGANDNASGTAALLELARPYARTPGSVLGVSPTHTIVFLSTDGGAFGGIGAARFAADSAYAERIAAVINLDTIAGPERPRIELAGDRARSPSATLVRTAAERLVDQTGAEPERPSALRQVADLGFPFSLYEHAPFVARDIPAITLTTAGDRPPRASADSPATLDGTRLAEVGRAAQQLLASLDGGLELAPSGESYVWLGTRVVRGWAIQVVLVAALLPFLAATVDLFARCRRRGVRVAPALRSFRSRLAFWLYAALLVAATMLLGVWPRGAARPPGPELAEDASWPVAALALLAVAAALGWIAARERLLPRRPVPDADELGGYVGALLALAAVAIAVAALNPFALVFVLPSVHAWLWLPHVRRRPAAVRLGLLAAGFAGPALALVAFGSRLDLRAETLWYLTALVSVGYVELPGLLALVAWLAVAGQLSALAVRRYAPYPGPGERGARGPIRETVRRGALALGVRPRRVASREGAEPPARAAPPP